MEKLKFNPSNKKYYSEEFIKGFECGVERQFEKDKAELTPIIRGKWIECDETIQCSNCGTTYIKHDNSIQYKRYCERCGAKMKGESDEKTDIQQ